MPRKAKGKPLTYRPVRLDNDVWAEFQRLGKIHGTINEGLRVAFGWNDPDIQVAPATEITEQLQHAVDEMIRSACPECLRRRGHSISCETGNAKAIARQQPVAVQKVAARRNSKVFKRELRPKGDKQR